jgi:hypothetical protein
LSFSKKDAEITLVGDVILKDRVAEKAEFVKRRTIEGKQVKLIKFGHGRFSSGIQSKEKSSQSCVLNPKRETIIKATGRRGLFVSLPV